jgi:hypothetical protein
MVLSRAGERGQERALSINFEERAARIPGLAKSDRIEAVSDLRKWGSVRFG